MSELIAALGLAYTSLAQSGWRQDVALQWQAKIRAIIEKKFGNADTRALQRHLNQVFNKSLKKGEKAIGSYKLSQLTPELRDRLNKKIMASAQLIKLNREAAIANTMKQFASWTSSNPASSGVNDFKDAVAKPLRSLPHQERRVRIDQASKFQASLDAVIAEDGGAIAAIWHSHWKQAGYSAREEHKKRHGKLFLIRDSWAIKEGLVKKPPELQYSDGVEQPAEWVYCSCEWEYVYYVEKLPVSCLTVAGKKYAKI